MSKRGPYKLSRAGGFFSMEREVYRSAAFKNLSPIERNVIFNLLYYFVPNKREDISMSGRRLGSELGINKDTAAKALKNLENLGFIRTTEESMWLSGRSRSYRLTFMAYRNRSATDDWKKLDFCGPNCPDNLSRQTGRSSCKLDAEVKNRPMPWVES